MNGIEKITARIEADAELEIAGIREKAGLEIADIEASFAKEAEAVKTAILERGAIKAKEKEDGLISTAQMEAKKLILAAKQEVLDEVFEKALAALTGMPADKKTELLAGLACSASVSGTEEVILNAADRAAVGEAAVKAANAKLASAGKKAALTLSDKTAEIEGGLILKDNNVEVNSAFDTLIRLNKKELSGEVAKILFN